MKLSELEPRWLDENVFVFRCPHCRNTWLSCKNAQISIKRQFEIFREANLEPAGPRYGVVLMNAEAAWIVGGKDFATMTVTPSIDASASGHWHGHITNGNIIGGI
jgi:hypothetical protein